MPAETSRTTRRRAHPLTSSRDPRQRRRAHDGPFAADGGGACDRGRPRRGRGRDARIRPPHARTGRPARALRRPRALGLPRPLPHLVTRAGRRPAGGRRLARRGARSRPRPTTTRRVDSGYRVARRQLGRAAHAPGARRGNGRDADRTLVEGLPLALAQHGRALPRGRRPGGRGRRRRARPAGRADRDPARGVRLDLPRALRHRLRGRVGRRDARGPPSRERARRDVDPRQGRLARRARDLSADPRARRAHAPRLAVAAARAALPPHRARAPLPPRRRLPPTRLPEGVHGRDARLAHGVAARRLAAS